MAPILSFTCEEAWDVLPVYKGKNESIHFEDFPELEQQWLEPETYKEWEELVLIREKVLKELESARENKLVGNSLEAQLSLKAPLSQLELLKKYQKDLPSLFIVSNVTLSSEGNDELEVTVSKANGDKCQRCWNFSTSVGTSEEYPLFCERCEEAVKSMNL
jgi:isoleucyl-tRNA synthetase